MADRTSADVLRAARQTLATVEKGLADLASGDPNRRVAGLHNLVVFGRAVTNVLQNLRSSEPDFDAWYGPHRAEMEADPLLKYLYELRSEILKEGVSPLGTSMHIHHFSFPQDVARLGPQIGRAHV